MKCPICNSENKDQFFKHCNVCGWEFTYFLGELSPDNMEAEKLRLDSARENWLINIDETTPSTVRDDDIYASNIVCRPTGERYAYAPTVIEQGKVEHIFVCQNRIPGIVKDFIYYHKRVNQTIVESIELLTPGENGAWDSAHVCDPTVIQGIFNYNNHRYKYALLYTGTDQDNCKNNQIGIAFSDCIQGPYFKYPYPLIFNKSGRHTWGVGQPSATSVNGKGKLLIFYSEGHENLTCASVAHLDLSNMSAIHTFFYKQIPSCGLTTINNRPDFINNFDVMYDPSSDLFYAIREAHPYPDSFPSFISSELSIVSIAGKEVWRGAGAWKEVMRLNWNHTGFHRNHNPGFVRSPFGTINQDKSLHIMFTTANSVHTDNSITWPSVLWTYEIWEAKVHVIN